MNYSQLEEKLFVYDEFETNLRENNEHGSMKNYFQFRQTSYHGDKVALYDSSSVDLVEISKQPRFLDIPMHIHTYIELCYVFSGSCTHEMDERDIKMQKHGILIMDSNVKHKIKPLDAGDIVINVMIKKDFFSQDVLEKLVPDSQLMEFALRSKTSHSHHENYIYYPTDYEKIEDIFRIMLCEYYDFGENSKTIIETCLVLLLEYLSRKSTFETNMTEKGKRQRSELKPETILDFISENYQDCSLESLEKHFRFNSHYLSTYLKKTTGKPFKEILIEEKMSHAKLLLDSTELPVTAIVNIVGFANPTFFYTKFHEIYGIPLSKYKRGSK
jgi:YesN/AraC family two-component response regulator